MSVSWTERMRRGIVREVGPVVFCLAVLLASVATAQPRMESSLGVPRVLPLGDSITDSSSVQPSYRVVLLRMAADSGYRFRFVGSQLERPSPQSADGASSYYHEGHSGWRADEILSRIEQWAIEASPDIVLIHLGHNDLCQGQSVQSTVKDLADIIDVLRSVNTRVRIVLAQIIRSSATCHSKIPELNGKLPDLVATKTSTSSPVLLADLYTGFVPETMTVEGVHPNASGNAWMAERWFERLQPLLRELDLAGR